jgi:hypothetical protein
MSEVNIIMEHICGLKRLFILDCRLAYGVTKYWLNHAPGHRIPVVILAHILTLIAAIFNIYLLAWKVKPDGIIGKRVFGKGPPSWFIRPLFLYLRGELLWQKTFSRK